jgi:hypothetical protein
MARPKRTLPIATLPIAPPQFTIDWQAVETAFGHNVPQSVRDDVHGVTERFLRGMQFDAVAEPLESASEMATAWKRAAAGFQRSLLKYGSGDSRSFVKSKIRLHFDVGPFHPGGKSVDEDNVEIPDTYMTRELSAEELIAEAVASGYRRRADVFEYLDDVLTSFVVACNKALAEMDSPESAYWDRWIRGLTRVLRRAQLPTGTRNTGGDFEVESAFTKFVYALQKGIPPRFRKHQLRRPTDSGLQALAKAIQRARTLRDK